MNLSELIYTTILRPKPLKTLANWIIKKLLPKTATVEGAVLHLNPNDPVVSGALALRVFERSEIQFFIKYFEPSVNFLDIGANIGLYSALALSRENHSGKIISFEPHNETFSYLEKTLEANRGNVQKTDTILIKKAASDISGKTTLFTNPENKGDNRLYNDQNLNDGNLVEVTTIDTTCQNEKVDNIGFVKIDVQGFEYKAISGARKVLSTSKDCIILSELWPYGLEKSGDSLNAYVDLLELLGFSLYELKGSGKIEGLDVDRIRIEFTGRKYTNIVGFKGKYQP